MKILRIHLLIVAAGILTHSSYSQYDTSFSSLNFEKLGVENLQFEPDSAGNMMVSTGRISKNLSELPLEVIVITHEEILKNHYTNLGDVLDGLPGFRVSRPGTGELGESFQLWGLTGNLYTKILINGIPIKPSVVSGMPIGDQLPVRQAEKIEIIYGNASSIYGADAVSGVINIILKDSDKSSFVRGDIGLGRGGYNNINFTIGGKGGKNNNILQYSFYGSKTEFSRMNIDYLDEDVYNPLNYFQAMGKTFDVGGNEISAIDVSEDALQEKGVATEDFIRENFGENYDGSLTRPEIEDLGSSSHMLGMNLSFRGIGLSYDNLFRKAHSSIGLSPVFYKYNNPQNYWGELIQKTTLRYARNFLNFSTKTSLSLLSYNMDVNSSQGVTFIPDHEKVYRYSASKDLMLEQVFSASLRDDLEISFGFSYEQSGNLPVTNYLWSPFPKANYQPFGENVDWSDPEMGNFGLNPIVYSNTSGFFHFYYIFRKFRFLGSMRYDLNTLYGNQFSPHIAFLHKTSSRTSFKISTGTSYKAPPASIAFQSLAYPVGSGIMYIQAPNPDLKAENFNTLEIRMNTRIGRKYHLQQTLFLYQIHDHIIPARRDIGEFDLINPVNDSVRTWINNEDAVSNVFGSQTTLSATNLIESVKLSAELSLIFQERQDKLPNVLEIFEDYFTLMPKHTGKLRLSMEPAEGFYTHIESQWMSKWLRLFIPFEKIYNEIFNESDGYYSLNLMSSYNLSPNLKIYIKIHNLLDEKYGSVNATFIEENLIYNPQLRRNVRFGLTYSLN